MKIICIIVLFSLLFFSAMDNNVVRKNGMTVEWEFIGEDQIGFKVSSPSSGWLAIGLNTENELVGSNLIMASVSAKQNIISDRYIVGLGDHRQMEELGVDSRVKLLDASESKLGTSVEFVIKTKSLDPYHLQLQRDMQIYLVLAYSHEDDFKHHSAMRTSVEIIL